MGQLVHTLRTAFTLVPWRLRPKLIGIALGSLLVALFDMLAVLLTLPMLELVSGTNPNDSELLRMISSWTGLNSPRSLLIAVLISVVILMTLKNVGTLMFRWWSLGVMANAQADAAEAMLKLYGRAAWERQRLRKRSDMLQTMNGYIGAAFGTTSDLIQLMVDVTAAAAVMGALLVVSPIATVVAAAFFGGTAWVLQATLKRAQIRLGERARRADVRAWNHLTPALEGFKEARIAGAGDRLAEDYAEARRVAAFSNRALGVLGELPRAILEILMIVGILVVAGVLFLTTEGDVAFAFLGVFAIGAMRIIPGLNRAVATLGRIRSNLPNVGALARTITDLRRDEQPELAAPDVHRFPPADIRVENVSYSFPDADTPVLRNVSAVLRRGETVALVGASGAGKTTFVELLMGLLRPQIGEVTAEGVPIHEHPQAWWRQLGLVAQDVYVLPRTIRENIAFGCPQDQMNDQRILEAISLAQLDDVLNGMEDGLDTVLGESGLRLSGGQRQRIGIARALYRKPQFLVLDEATSALDNETEFRITETIKSLRGSMTIVVVAHRLSTVKHADQILFFSEGEIADRGTMAELTQRNVEFANLVRLGQLN